MLVQIFKEILNMSLTCIPIFAVILIVRFVLNRFAPKKYAYILWAVLLFRLVCPITFEAPFSAVNESISSGQVIQHVMEQEIEILPTITEPSIESEVQIPDSQSSMTAVPETATVETSVMPALSIAWLIGIIAIFTYSILSLVKLQNKLVGAINIKENIYISDYIDSPFVLGLLKAKIYLPSSLSESESSYIILHEKYHIKRMDHIFKIIAFIALCIHWFNPAVWLSFVLSVKDMEMSCDEAVLIKMGESIRTDYSASLLSLSTGRTRVAMSPLAFGEGNTSSRIKNILKWKKPVILMSSIAAVLCLIVGVFCIPNKNNTNNEITEAWNLLHTSCFTYMQTQVTTYKDDSNLTLEIEGAYTPDPMVFTQKIISGDALWNENYIYLDQNSQYKGVIKIDGEWIESIVDQTDPIFHGYNERERIKILSKENISKNGVSYKLFKTEYEVDISSEYGLDDSLNAIISQEYLLNKETGLIEHILTDTTELNKATNIALHMSFGDTYEAAVEKALTNMNTKENTTEVQISYPDESFVLEIPELRSDSDEPHVVDMYKAGDDDVMITYYLMSDGTYKTDEYTYKYRYERSGKISDAAAGVTTYVILSNRRNVTFEEAVLSQFSSDSTKHFDPSETKIVEMKSDIITAIQVPTRTQKFDDILGLSGYFEVYKQEGYEMKSFFTTINNVDHCFAETWGKVDEHYSVDLDQDGINELICNVLYSDGLQQTMLYKREGNTIYQGFCDDLLDEEYDDFSYPCEFSYYVPEENVVRIFFYKADKLDYESKDYKINLDKIRMWEFTNIS